MLRPYSPELVMFPDFEFRTSLGTSILLYTLFALGRKVTASQFNFTYRYIDSVLSINNSDFENYLGQMYPTERKIKDTEESTSASYFDLILPIWREGRLRTLLYAKCVDFNFSIINSLLFCSNIPSPAYGVCISRVKRYALLMNVIVSKGDATFL